MLLAIAYPEPGRGRGHKDEALKSPESGGFGRERLRQARTVLRKAPDLAPLVAAGSMPLGMEAEKAAARSPTNDPPPKEGWPRSSRCGQGHDTTSPARNLISFQPGPPRSPRRAMSRSPPCCLPRPGGDPLPLWGNDMGYSLGQAARAAGCSKTTIHRAIAGGRLSAARTETGGWSIDPAELARAFPPDRAGNGTVERSVTTEDPVTVRVERDMLRSLAEERAEAIRDLRSRLDASEAERRQLGERLAGLLPAPVAPKRRWWRRR